MSPCHRSFGTNGNIQYIYTANGTKLRKVVTNGSTITTTDYDGNYIYTNSALSQILQPEGYIVPNGNTYQYYFQYRDNLSSNRLTYSDFNGDGTISSSEIVEEDNYYPFGLKQQGYNNTHNGTGSKYKYNGKELQDDAVGSYHLNLYDYGARFYDPAIGRWTTEDPLAEKSRRWSPYNYAINNPIRIIDPDGNTIEIPQKDSKFRNYILVQMSKLTRDNLSLNKNGEIVISKRVSGDSKAFGTKVVEQLIGSKNTHFILHSTIGDNHSAPLFGTTIDASNGHGTGTTIMIDPKSNVKVPDQDNVVRVIPKQIVLGHELIHSYHADLGIQEPQLANPKGNNYPLNFGSGIPLTKEEINTRKRENILRTEEGIKHLRKVSDPNKVTELPEVEIK